jgi:aryl-alcohol dehydrogenase-like predicted oxidoreductase
MICFCVTNDPILKRKTSLRGQGELQKPDQDVTPAAKIEGDLDAGEELVQQMKAAKQSLAAHKAWVTRRANAAKAALAAIQPAS